MDYGLFVLGVLTDKVLIVGGKVDYGDICWYVVEDFVLFEELALGLGEVV